MNTMLAFRNLLQVPSDQRKQGTHSSTTTTAKTGEAAVPSRQYNDSIIRTVTVDRSAGLRLALMKHS